MKYGTINYVNNEEFEKLREKYKNKLYYESKKYKTLKLSKEREIRTKK